MPLSKGVRLGPYEIVAALGAGGMGEVYRGRDTRLDRSVAIKVVLDGAATAEARQRFELEARAISALQHPHICALHDVGSQDGIDFLVMELVDGETLAARLARGPLPLAEALRHGAQIADALAGAHRRGIVHRDLKPANVMLTKSGVKLLDFGLARRRGSPVQGGVLSQEMTRLAAPLTAEGTILGTLHYMAPEQLEGRPVDARADLFALGAVLYEMITGARAFDGTSPASVISSILRERPPAISARVPLAPPALDRLVEHCLAKDPDERWESAHDLRLQLEQVAAGGMSSGAPAGVAAAWRWLPWGIAATAAAVALGLAAFGLRARDVPAARPAVRFELSPPPGATFYTSVEASAMALAPDGSVLAFLAWEPGRPSTIWLRRLDELAARPLAGTEGASSLFWSPDGKALAFVGDGKLKRVDLPDGAPVVLCNVPSGIGVAGSWGRRDTILFGTVGGDGIHAVPARGGEPRLVLAAERAPNDDGRALGWPWYLPDGERFLFLSTRGQGGFELRLAGPDGTSRAVATTSSRVELIDGRTAVFVRDGALIAQPFDAERGELAGVPVALSPTVRTFGSTGSASFATGGGGTVALAAQGVANRLTWFDRAGRALGTLGPPADSASISIAPDGRRALTDRLRAGLATYDLWQLDLERGVETPLTSEPGSEVYGLWLPGGRTILYSASSGGSPRLYRRDLASGRDEPLLPEAGFQMAAAVTPDGGEVVLRQRAASGGFELWTLRLAPGAEPTRLLRAGLAVWSATLSPDGEVLAYVTTESGRPEAYVRLRGGGEAIRASIDGARDVRYGRDGRTLYFTSLSPNRRLFAVAVTAAPELAVGTPEALFALPPPLGWAAFDVAPDGRFLALVPEVDPASAPLTVISGWSPPR